MRGNSDTKMGSGSPDLKIECQSIIRNPDGMTSTDYYAYAGKLFDIHESISFIESVAEAIRRCQHGRKSVSRELKQWKGLGLPK